MSTTNINEKKVKEENRFKNHVQGRIISQNEMVHLILRYPEVYSDLNFVAVPTMPLELRAGVDKGCKEISDSSKSDIISDIIRKDIIDFEWRHHTDSERLIMSDIEKCNLTIDKFLNSQYVHQN